MIEDVAVAISTGAAGNIVAYMLNGRMDALRAQVTKMFRHGTEHERSAVLRTLEDDAVALTQQKKSEADVTAQWSSLLLSYLPDHPEAREEIESFASSPTSSKTVNIGSQNFYGSASFGGDNNGTINFSS